jgi:hypothetical protein
MSLDRGTEPIEGVVIGPTEALEVGPAGHIAARQDEDTFGHAGSVSAPT